MLLRNGCRGGLSGATASWCWQTMAGPAPAQEGCPTCFVICQAAGTPPDSWLSCSVSRDRFCRAAAWPHSAGRLPCSLLSDSSSEVRLGKAPGAAQAAGSCPDRLLWDRSSACRCVKVAGELQLSGMAPVRVLLASMSVCRLARLLLPQPGGSEPDSPFSPSFSVCRRCHPAPHPGGRVPVRLHWERSR